MSIKAILQNLEYHTHIHTHTRTITKHERTSQNSLEEVSHHTLQEGDTTCSTTALQHRVNGQLLEKMLEVVKKQIRERYGDEREDERGFLSFAGWSRSIRLGVRMGMLALVGSEMRGRKLSTGGS